MATRQVNTVLQQLRRVVRLREEARVSDAQLLGCFIERRDEAAFETLVRRHGPMVLGVCRRLLRNPHDAEDAFQATFLVLVRKATSISPRALVGNWLYGVAYQTALKARVAAARRQTRERQVMDMPDPEARADVWPDLQPLLDAELSRLPDKYRVPVVLCDLEGKTRKEAAAQLGWPEGTLSGRLSRAREMLAKRLVRRGLTLSAGALALLLAENAARACLPHMLAQSTVKAGILLAAGKVVGGVVSAQALALSEGVVHAMLTAKLKIACVVMMAVAVLGFGASALTQRGAASLPFQASAQGGSPTVVKEPDEPRTEDAREKADAWTLDLRFKALRPITVDVPKEGKKTFLYLRYDIINTTGEERTFIPAFELVQQEKAAARADVVQPEVFKAVVQQEDPTGLLNLKDSVTIAKKAIPVSKPNAAPKTVSGIALWEEVDPEATRLSVFVAGLSNAWTTTEPKPPATEPVLRRKTLQLNFKKKGDEFVFVPPAQWVYRQAKPAVEDKKGSRPKDTDPQPSDPLKEVKDRQAVADQRASEIVREAMDQAKALVTKAPDEAHDLLERTLDQVQNDPDLSPKVRRDLVEQLRIGLKDLDRLGTKVQREQKTLAEMQSNIAKMVDKISLLKQQEQEWLIERDRLRERINLMKNVVARTAADKESEKYAKAAKLLEEDQQDLAKGEKEETARLVEQEALKDRLAVLEKEYEELLSKQSAERPTEADKRADEVKKAKDAIAKLEEQVKNAQKDRTQLDDKIRNLQAELELLRKRLNNLDQPAEKDTQGSVKAVEDNLLLLSIGADKGLHKGDRLEIYRLQPQPKYVGQAEVIDVSAGAAVARMTKMAPGQSPRVGDQAATRLTGPTDSKP
jgi:RNA polymerase sigma factor (sigma-70 family)